MVDLGPFPRGMNNRQDAHNLPAGAVRNAVNADCNNSGHWRRRKGGTKVISCANGRASCNCPLGSFFVDDQDLKRFNGASPADIVLSGVHGEHCTFDYFNGVLYFSDGLISRKIKAGNIATQWGMDAPAAPVLSGVTGAYGAGTYLGAITWVDADGVESGASEIVSIVLSDSTGVRFNRLPNTADPQVEYMRLYLSKPNGSTLYKVADVATGTSHYVVSIGDYSEGKYLDTAFLSKPPPGRIVRYHKGRFYIADDAGLIWYTEPHAIDHVARADSYIQTPGPVTIMEPVESGIFVVADKHYFYQGSNPKEFSVVDKFDYGAVLGTGQRVPHNDNVMWYSERGFVVGTPAGQTINIQEDNVAVHSGESGKVLIREEDGVRSAVASIKGPIQSQLAATDFIQAEKVRRGE